MGKKKKVMNTNLEANRQILRTRLVNLLNELIKNDIAINGSVYEFTSCENGRPCMCLDFGESIWGEDVEFHYYIDTMERVL